MSGCGCDAAICGGARGPVHCQCLCHRELPAEIRSAPESVPWTLSAARERDANGHRTFIRFGRQVRQTLTAHALNDRANLLALVRRLTAAARELVDCGDDLLELAQHEPGCHHGGVSGLRCSCRLPAAAGSWEKAAAALRQIEGEST